MDGDVDAPARQLSASATRTMNTPPVLDSASAPAERRVGWGADKTGWYLAMLLFTVISVYTYQLRTKGIFACPSGADSGEYLGYCHATGYGDFDHGALWFGLEPIAQANAKDAAVLFVGSSRLQFAFSSTALSDWFQSRAISYYLLGFSHFENMAFLEPLLEKLKPRAALYVVNVDRFFDNTETPPAADLLRGDGTFERYQVKKRWQQPHRLVCSAIPALCGDSSAYFRRREDGSWKIRGSGGFKPAAVSDGEPSDVERWPEFARLASAFVAALPVERDCVIMTIAPYHGTKRAEAEAIAKAVGVPLIAPRLDGLNTFDGSHLDPTSAELWAQAFLESAASTVERCSRRAR